MTGTTRRPPSSSRASRTTTPWSRSGSLRRRHPRRKGDRTCRGTRHARASVGQAEQTGRTVHVVVKLQRLDAPRPLFFGCHWAGFGLGTGCARACRAAFEPGCERPTRVGVRPCRSRTRRGSRCRGCRRWCRRIRWRRSRRCARRVVRRRRRALRECLSGPTNRHEGGKTSCCDLDHGLHRSSQTCGSRAPHAETHGSVGRPGFSTLWWSSKRIPILPLLPHGDALTLPDFSVAPGIDSRPSLSMDLWRVPRYLTLQLQRTTRFHPWRHEDAS